jgi:putative RNA 2'-phosphotransferase
LIKRSHQIKVDNLSRFLVYVLGRRPDEFGLVPDSDGAVTVKELLQAVHEEPGWQYVRRSHINEVLLGKDRALFQAEKERISVLERLWSLDCESRPSEALPKILFTPIRTRAHPVVMEKGLNPGEGKYLVLSPDREMALRIGKRRDHNPVVLEIMSSAAASKGILFFPFGILFLSRDIPARFISGPPVSKEVMERRSDTEPKKDKAVPGPVDFAAGSLTLDPSRDPDLHRRAQGQTRRGWKEDARRIRRGKG